MLKSSLIQLLKTFSPGEMKEFGEYISSPYFNKNKNVTALFNAIKKYYPDFESKNLAKEKMYQKLFPGEKYNDGTIRLLMHYLSEASKNFIVLCNINKKTYSYLRALTEELIDRDLFGQFEKHLNDTLTEFNKTVIKDEDYYYNRFLLEYEYLYYLSEAHFDEHEKFAAKTNVENIFNYLTDYYLLRALKLYIYVLNTAHIYKIDFKTDAFDNSILNFNQQVYEDVPGVNIYFNLLMAIKFPEKEDYYLKLKELFHKHESTLPDTDVLNIYINLENYCRRKIRTGSENYVKELFELYKAELDKKVYLMNNYMPRIFYLNVAVTGLKLKEYKWVHEFINSYKNELKEEHGESTYFYSSALYEFETKNYENAMKYLSKVKYDQVYLKLDIKVLQSRIYYETNSGESLVSLIDTFRHNVANDRLIPDDRKAPYVNYIRFLRKIINAKNNRDGMELEQLREELKSEEKVSEKEWLLEKVEELGRQ